MSVNTVEEIGHAAPSGVLSPVKLAKLLRAEDLQAFQDALGFLEGREWETQRMLALKIMERLQNSRNVEVRQAAADWLGEKAGHIAHEEAYKNFNEVVTVLRAARDGDEAAQVRDSARTSLNAIRQTRESSERHKCLQSVILNNGDQDEDEVAQAIAEMADPKLGSREELRFLVDQWIKWIGDESKARRLGLISQAIRYNWFAVLPLVEHFGRKSLAEKEAGAPGEQLASSGEGNGAQESQDGPPQPPEQAPPEPENGSLLRLRQIARQLADMSDPRFFDMEQQSGTYTGILQELQRHAVAMLARRLSEQEDREIREHIVRMLAYTGGREAIDALARRVVGREGERSNRQDIMAEYYLEPSKRSSEQAAEILKGAVAESQTTLLVLRTLNIAVFIVGLVVLSLGLYLSMSSQGAATRIAGGLAAIGGLAGVIARLVKDPLDRIQNAMSNLVQLETAFTSFIWELNLNGTFIQSLYVNQGELKDEEIAQTVGRIENAMQLTMNLVSTYTEENEPRLVTRIHNIEPAAAPAGSAITVYGQHLQGDSSQKKERSGLVAIDHAPAPVEDLTWKNHAVKFRLPSRAQAGPVRVSLLIDGIETNALPFHVVEGTG